MLCKKKNQQLYEAHQWFGNHPKVKNLATGKGSILTRQGIKTVNKGDWIVRIRSSEYTVYSQSDFNFHYELVIND